MQDELAKAGLVQIEPSPLDAIECAIHDIDNSESIKVELPINPIEEEENKRKELVRTKHARDAAEAVRIRMENHRINIAKEDAEGESVSQVDNLLDD
jgi:predicted ATP-grasp superfamily ATP-dependent carboligase